jgi:hypothetical protein
MRYIILFVLITCPIWSYIDFNGRYPKEQNIVFGHQINKKRSFSWGCFPTHKNQLFKILNQFKRPFSVIDVGCRQGFYSLSIAEKYPAVVTLLEGNYVDFPMQAYQTYSILKDNSHLNNLIFLPVKPLASQIENLAACEHFDVVMVMNPIGSFHENWKEGVRASLKLGFVILIERPAVIDRLKVQHQKWIEELDEYLKELGGEALSYEDFSESVLYLFKFPKRVMTKTTYILPKTNRRQYEIFSDFQTCKLHKSSEDGKMRWISDWIPGINLVTFKLLSGAIPSKHEILQEVERLSYLPHNDWMINNMIVQGKKLELIDWDDTNWAPPIKRSNGMYCPIQKYKKIVEIINEKDLKKVEEKLRSLL